MRNPERTTRQELKDVRRQLPPARQHVERLEAKEAELVERLGRLTVVDPDGGQVIEFRIPPEGDLTA